MVLVLGGGYWLAGIYGALAWVDYITKLAESENRGQGE